MQRKVLSEAFQEVLRGRRIRAAVFLTFRFDPGFFEQEVLPVFFDIPLSHAPQVRLLHLEQILRQTGPIAVYYDRRALEAGAASARTDFQRIGVTHRTGYFHPKNVLLLVEENEPDSALAQGAPPRRNTSLIVASTSANLTRAGWWENVEVGHIEETEENQSCGFRDDLLSVISTLRRVSPEGTDHAALDVIQAFVRSRPQGQQRLRQGTLNPRLFSGDRELTDFLEEVAGHRLQRRCLEIISPYFDGRESPKPLVALLKRFRPRETRIFLPRGAEREALCSERYWRAVTEAGAAWATLPREVTKLSRDRDRFVHAKVYRFFDPADRRETFFVGSVNLTNAGFGKAGNIESGFLIEHEASRKSDWWLRVDSRRPAAFVEKDEDDGVASGPGAHLVLRFDWREESARAFWDAPLPSPPLVLLSAGVRVGELGPLGSQLWTRTSSELAAALKEHLRSSSFLTMRVVDAPDSILLVDEENAVHKPSLLATLSPDDILRFWSLLTAEQKREFLEEHADELGDEEVALHIGDNVPRPTSMDNLFGTFAQVYLSFGNLEQTIRASLAERRNKEVEDRIFGRKFDSLRRLVERIREEKEDDAVRAYVSLLCAIQLIDLLRAEQPELFADQRRKLDAETRDVLTNVKTRFGFATDKEQTRFFAWFERWFLRRATPKKEQPAA